MAIFKCKMCGGNLEITGDTSVITCAYCGTNQTISKSRDEVVSNLYNRANDLRLKCEFDRAEQTYEKIIDQDNAEAEAHWGIVLCRYGIEYVEDHKTGKRIPTCHRTSYEAITSDADYLATIENADDEQKKIYEQEAKEIDEIQKNILNIVKNEEPFDVFICYKETDENGNRTIDSSIANDIYYQLTQEGYKVFYAPITLEDKLGQEYEPYIFAALNSAKVMLVVGTKPEYFNAVWVKNEWSRYLKLLKTDRSKMIIPCYRDMDAYDLPDEFAHLQSQDMSKIGFISDVVRGINKVINSTKTPNNIRNNPNDTIVKPFVQNSERTIQEKLDTQILLKKIIEIFRILSVGACLFLGIVSFLEIENLTFLSITIYDIISFGLAIAFLMFGLVFAFRKKIPFLQFGYLISLATCFFEGNESAVLYPFFTTTLFASFLFATIISILPKKGVSSSFRNIVNIISIILFGSFAIACLDSLGYSVGIVITCTQILLFIVFEGYDAVNSKIEKLKIRGRLSD